MNNAHDQPPVESPKEDIRITNTLDGVTWADFPALILAVGWGERDPVRNEHAFRKASFVRFAWLGERLIACGRTTDDGEFCGVICDLVVHPEFQGTGIGSRILRELRDEMVAKDFVFISLTSNPGKDEFYLKHQWKRQKSAMIWPMSEKQASDHAV
jgi:GNAT superfamily N-acetyltransferase